MLLNENEVKIFKKKVVRYLYRFTYKFGDDFEYSIDQENLTIDEKTNELRNYFYQKGMTVEEYKAMVYHIYYIDNSQNNLNTIKKTNKKTVK